MATVTTDFPTTYPPRSRADRLTDGVIAGYIRALDAATTRTRAVIPPVPTALTASRGHGHESTQRTASSWGRAGRGGCSRQPKRLLEAL
jgi:hypothetical protein